MYIDYAKYTQDELDKIAPGKYKVSNERNLDLNFNEVNVVVHALSGTIYDSSANLPYQMDIYTNSPKEEMDFFQNYAKIHNKTIIESYIPVDDNKIKHYSILQIYATPTVLESDLPAEFGDSPMSHIAMFITLLPTEGVSDIREVKIDGELIQCFERSLTLGTETISNRVYNSVMNDNQARTASMTLALQLIHKETVFCNKLSKMRQGTFNINNVFNITLTFSNGTTEEYWMRVIETGLTSADSRLPSIYVKLASAEKPEEV